MPPAVVLLCLFLLAGCGQEFGSLAEARAAYAREGLGPVVIAAVEDPLGPDFIQGIELAVTEINRADGGLLGRPLQLRRFAGSEALRPARRVAWQIAKDPRIAAVLGYRRSELAVPLSVIFERAQVLFLPSFATAEQLTRFGFAFILRMLPDNAAMAAQTASIAQLFGHRRIAVLHGRDDHARELAFLFQDEARARGLQVVFGASFFERETNFRGLLGQLSAVQFDALYLSADQAAGAELIRQLRELGFAQPVFGSDRLDAGELASLTGAAGDHIVTPIVYDVGAPGPRNRAFVAAYQAAYGEVPGQDAAQGYDSVRLFASIVRSAGSTEPRVLATTGRYAPPWAGVTGIFSYDPRGNIHGKVFEFRVLRFGRWWFLPGVTAPFRLASFQAARVAMAREDQVAGNGATPTPAVPVADPVAAATPGSSPSPSPGFTPDPFPGTAAADPVALDTLTDARLSTAERNRIWLTLAHDILGFERLGLVVPPTAAGSAALILARMVAAERGFTVESCALPTVEAAASEPRDAAVPGGSPETPEGQAAVRCWSRLARSVDSLMLVPDAGLDPELVRRLNLTLRDFGVPSFALAPASAADLGLTLALVASGIDLNDPEVALRFNGLLRGLPVHALNRKLTNLPAVSADLDAFAVLGIRPDPRLLTLVSRAIEPESIGPAMGSAAPAAAVSPATGG